MPETPMFLKSIRTGERLDPPLLLITEGDPGEFLQGVIDEALVLSVPHGSDFTLLPADDFGKARLAELYRVLQMLDEPTRSMAFLQAKIDGVVSRVEALFKPVEYHLIESTADLADLVAYYAGRKPSYHPKEITRQPLGDLVADIVGEPPQDE